MRKVVKRVNRIYVIEFDLFLPAGGVFKYAIEPKSEHRVEYFGVRERDNFIERYEYLSSSENSLYYDNIICYTAILEVIPNMEDIIKAI